MSRIGSHLAFEPGLAAPERFYLRAVGPPEPSLRVRTAHVLRALDRLAPARVLDAGAGAGFTAIALAQRRPASTVVALDIDEPQIERGRRLAASAGASNVSFVAADVLSYEPSEPFDAVVCVDALEYFADDVQLLRRVRSWLVPGGSLVLHCRATPAAYRRGVFKATDFRRDGRVRDGYSRPQLTDMLTDAGFVDLALHSTLTAPAELAYELVDPELGVFRGKAVRALAAPPLLLIAQLDRFALGRGAGLLAVARRAD